MSILVIIAIVVGTLVFAWLFDKFFGLIFRDKKSKEHTVKDFYDFAHSLKDLKW